MSWLCTMASKSALRTSRTLAVRRSFAWSRRSCTIWSGAREPLRIARIVLMRLGLNRLVAPPTSCPVS